MKYTLTTLALGAIALSLGAAEAKAAAFITNGSFEINGGVGQLTAGISSAAGWSVGPTVDGAPSPFVFIVNANADSTGFTSVYSPPNIKVWGPGTGVNNGFTGSGDGSYFLGVDGDYARAPISQVVTGLTVGSQYTLAFQWAASQFTDATGATQQKWGVTFGGDTVSTSTYNLPSQGFSGWMNYSHTFTASNASQTLSFLASGTPAGLPPFLLLDGVTLTEEAIVAEAPEPGSVMLLLGGVAALIGFGRRSSARKQ